MCSALCFHGYVVCHRGGCEVVFVDNVHNGDIAEPDQKSPSLNPWRVVIPMEPEDYTANVHNTGLYVLWYVRGILQDVQSDVDYGYLHATPVV